MIKINDKFSCEFDSYCWNLYEKYTGKDRNGNDKEHTKITYHANFEQICRVILDRTLGKCQSIEELLEVHTNLGNELKEFIKQNKKDIHQTRTAK